MEGHSRIMSDASERHHVTRQRADGRGALAGRHPGRLLSRVWPTPYEYRDTARHVSGSGSLTDIEGGDDVDEGEDEANVVEGVIDPSPPSMDIDQPFRHRNITSAELRSEAQYRRDYPQVRTRLEKLYISREQSGTGAVDAEQHAADSTAVDEALVAGPSSPITASAVAPLEALERRALVAMSHALTPASAAAPAVTIEQRALDTVALPPIPASPVALVEGVEHRVVAAENNPRKRGREDENAEETKAKRFCPMLRSPLCHIREQSPDDARAVECIVAAGPSTAAHPQLPVVPDNATTGESIVAAGPSTGAQPQLPFEGIVAAGPSTGVAPQLPVIVSAPAVMRSCAHLVKPWSPLTLRRHKARVKTEREARADLADRNAAGFLGDGLTLYTLAPNWQIFRLRQVTVDEREMRGPSKKKTNVRGCRGSHKSTSPVMLRRLRRPLEGHTRADRLESGRCAPEDAFDKYNMDRDRRLLRLVNVNKYQRRPAVINAVHAARARIDWSTHREESIQWCHEMQAKFTARRVAAELVAAEEAQRRAAVLAAAEEAQRVAAELAATEEAQRVAAEEANRAAEARAADERRRLAAHAEERARVERQEQLIRAERNAVNAIPRRPAPRQRQQPTTDDIMRMARRMQLEEQCRIRDDINARNVENILAQERERLAQQDRIAAEHAEEQQRRDQLDAQERALAAHHARMDEARAQAEYINQARAAQAQVQVHATSNEPGIAALRAAEARLEAFQTRSRAGSEDEVVRHVSNLHLDWDIDEQQVDGLLPAAEIVPGPRMVRRGSSASLVSSPPDYFEETEADLRAASPPPAFPPPNWSPGSQVLPTFDERHAHTHVPHANMTVAESMAYWARRANEQRNVLDAEMEINRRLAHDNRPDQPAAAHAAGIVTIEEPVRRAPIPRRSGPVNHANIEALELAQINALSDNARFRNVRAEGMFAEGPDEIGALDRQFDRLPSEPVDFEHVHHGEREPRLPGTFEPEPIDEQASQDSAQNGGVVGAILGFVRSLW